MNKPEIKEDTPRTLEEAMARLDQLVKEMEAGTLSLEALIAKYEEGTALSKFCREKLDQAETKIRLIARDAEGNPTLEPFAAKDDE